MKKHGNVKYRFHELVNIGDRITERPNNIYSLKAAFRNYNIKRNNEDLPTLIVDYDEYGGKRVDLTLKRFEDPKKRTVETNLATINASTNTITGQQNLER